MLTRNADALFNDWRLITRYSLDIARAAPLTGLGLQLWLDDFEPFDMRHAQRPRGPGEERRS